VHHLPFLEDSEHHVLEVARRGQRGHAELHLLAVAAPELDLAVLGETPFRDIEVGHDLDARDDGRPVAVGNGLVERAAAVDTVSDLHILAAEVGLDVDVRGTLGDPVVDDAVDQLHDHAVGLRDAVLLELVLVLDQLALAAQQVAEGLFPLRRLIEVVDELDDVLLERDAVLDGLRPQEVLDHVLLQDVVGVVDDDADLPVGPFFQGHPELAAEVLALEALEKVLGDGVLCVVVDEPAAVKVLEGAADVIAGDPEPLHEDLLDGFVAAARLREGRLEVGVLHEVVVDEVVESGLAPRRDTMLVVQGDAEDLGDLLQEGPLVVGEPAAALAVDDLDDPHKGVFVHDGQGEHLGGSVARLPVPGLIEEEGLVDLLELLLVVDIRDADAPARVGHESGDAAVVDGQADLLELGACQVEGVELAPRLVRHVDRDQQGIEEREDPFLVLDEDVLDVLRGVDLVGDVEQFLALVELLGEGRYGGDVEPLHHLCRVHRGNPFLLGFSCFHIVMEATLFNTGNVPIDPRPEAPARRQGLPMAVAAGHGFCTLCLRCLDLGAGNGVRDDEAGAEDDPLCLLGKPVPELHGRAGVSQAREAGGAVRP